MIQVLTPYMAGIGKNTYGTQKKKNPIAETDLDAVGMSIEVFFVRSGLI
jgi:hypothetical protein